MNRVMSKITPLLMGAFLISAAWGAETKEVYKATIDGSGIQKIEMIGGSYYFKPNDIIVKVNVPVEIMIKKEPGAAPHNIVLHAPEAEIDFKVELSTDPKVIKLTPTKTGKYPFYCDHRFLFWTQRAKGMGLGIKSFCPLGLEGYPCLSFLAHRNIGCLLDRNCTPLFLSA